MHNNFLIVGNQRNRGSKDVGKRLDRVLAEWLKISRKKAKHLLDQGVVQVNGRKVVIASWELQKGDRVSMVAETEASHLDAGEYFLKVVYEDPHILVIDKEAGIPCEESRVATKPTIVAIVNAYLRRKYPHLKGHYVGLLHRLDQDTSGLMVYSRSREANVLSAQFKSHTIKRKYKAVVAGSIEGPGGKIEGYLQKSALLSRGQKVKLSTPESGRPAVTVFKVVERYPKASLVEIQLNTGRTHQIRVHMASIGHPVVGDKSYGESTGMFFPRQALHASFLGFHHPVTGKKMEFASELPRDMRRLVDRLRLRS